jgi:hypothetical protein
MTLKPCVHENEIRESLKRGHWPDGCTPDLRAHGTSCRSCSDLILITQTFRNAGLASAQSAKLNTSGLLWWRAQLRRRSAAVERMNKPLIGAQVFALSLNLLIIATVIATQARHGLHWAEWQIWRSETWLSQIHPFRMFREPSQWTSTSWTSSLTALSSRMPGSNLTILVSSLAILALFAGILFYLATEEQ